MAKPQPAEASWEDLMMGQVDAKIAARETRKKPHRDFKTRVPLSAAPILVEAARRRGMSVAAYTRRASLAFAAHDLGLDLRQLLEDEPVTRGRFDGFAGDRAEQGQGHGDWVIGGLK